MKRVLFVAAHRRDRSPSQRFRFEQYMDFLSRNGFQCEHSSLISAEDDRVFYSPGLPHRKAIILLRCFLKRVRDVRRASRYDIVFIQREAFMTGTTIFERRFARSSAKVVFDFDDSIWMENVSDANRGFAFLKNAAKTSRIIALSDLVFAGNPYLANYARRFNPSVSIVPTTIDTDEYQPRQAYEAAQGPVVIGWSGSVTTIQHFRYALPFLTKVKKKYGDRVSIEVIGDGSYSDTSIGVSGRLWNKATELADLSRFDVGIMPLPDDEWAKGKCGLKGLQYMALGIPTIMSPVGVNTEIIQDGLNGYLAGEPDQWVDRLSALIDSAELRARIGRAGRQTVVDRYSVSAFEPVYLEQLKMLLRESG